MSHAAKHCGIYFAFRKPLVTTLILFTKLVAITTGNNILYVKMQYRGKEQQYE